MSEVVFIGIDLGTSRTSITTSTGVRTTVWSYVGYAQDHVSRKHLGGREKARRQEHVQRSRGPYRLDEAPELGVSGHEAQLRHGHPEAA